MLSKDAQEQIISMLKDGKKNYIPLQTAKALIGHNLGSEQIPEVWNEIGNVVLEAKSSNLEAEHYMQLAACLVQSGCKNQELIKSIKEHILTISKEIDASSFIDLRNAFVEHYPEERAYISFLEMKTISRFFLFGRSQRSPIYPGQAINKKLKSIPLGLERVLEQSAKQARALKTVLRHAR